MAYKVGSTTVIDNSGNIAWDRLSNVGIPVKDTELVKGANSTYYVGGGNVYSAASHVGMKFNTSTSYQDVYRVTISNCTSAPPSNCNCVCYC